MNSTQTQITVQGTASPRWQNQKHSSRQSPQVLSQKSHNSASGPIEVNLTQQMVTSNDYIRGSFGNCPIKQLDMQDQQQLQTQNNEPEKMEIISTMGSKIFQNENAVEFLNNSNSDQKPDSYQIPNNPVGITSSLKQSLDSNAPATALIKTQNQQDQNMVVNTSGDQYISLCQEDIFVKDKNKQTFQKAETFASIDKALKGSNNINETNRQEVDFIVAAAVSDFHGGSEQQQKRKNGRSNSDNYLNNQMNPHQNFSSHNDTDTLNMSSQAPLGPRQGDYQSVLQNQKKLQATQQVVNSCKNKNQQLQQKQVNYNLSNQDQHLYRINQNHLPNDKNNSNNENMLVVDQAKGNINCNSGELNVRLITTKRPASIQNGSANFRQVHQKVSPSKYEEPGQPQYTKTTAMFNAKQQLQRNIEAQNNSAERKSKATKTNDDNFLSSKKQTKMQNQKPDSSTPHINNNTNNSKPRSKSSNTIRAEFLSRFKNNPYQVPKSSQNSQPPKSTLTSIKKSKAHKNWQSPHNIVNNDNHCWEHTRSVLFNSTQQKANGDLHSSLTGPVPTGYNTNTTTFEFAGTTKKEGSMVFTAQKPQNQLITAGDPIMLSHIKRLMQSTGSTMAIANNCATNHTSNMTHMTYKRTMSSQNTRSKLYNNTNNSFFGQGQQPLQSYQQQQQQQYYQEGGPGLDVTGSISSSGVIASQIIGSTISDNQNVININNNQNNSSTISKRHSSQPRSQKKNDNYQSTNHRRSDHTAATNATTALGGAVTRSQTNDDIVVNGGEIGRDQTKQQQQQLNNHAVKMQQIYQQRSASQQPIVFTHSNNNIENQFQPNPSTFQTNHLVAQKGTLLLEGGSNVQSQKTSGILPTTQYLEQLKYTNNQKNNSNASPEEGQKGVMTSQVGSGMSKESAAYFNVPINQHQFQRRQQQVDKQLNYQPSNDFHSSDKINNYSTGGYGVRPNTAVVIANGGTNYYTDMSVQQLLQQRQQDQPAMGTQNQMWHINQNLKVPFQFHKNKNNLLARDHSNLTHNYQSNNKSALAAAANNNHNHNNNYDGRSVYSPTQANTTSNEGPNTISRTMSGHYTTTGRAGFKSNVHHYRGNSSGTEEISKLVNSKSGCHTVLSQMNQNNSGNQYIQNGQQQQQQQQLPYTKSHLNFKRPSNGRRRALISGQQTRTDNNYMMMMSGKGDQKSSSPPKQQYQYQQQQQQQQQYMSDLSNQQTGNQQMAGSSPHEFVNNNAFNYHLKKKINTTNQTQNITNNNGSPQRQDEYQPKDAKTGQDDDAHYDQRVKRDAATGESFNDLPPNKPQQQHFDQTQQHNQIEDKVDTQDKVSSRQEVLLSQIQSQNSQGDKDQHQRMKQQEKKIKSTDETQTLGSIQRDKEINVQATLHQESSCSNRDLLLAETYLNQRISIEIENQTSQQNQQLQSNVNHATTDHQVLNVLKAYQKQNQPTQQIQSKAPLQQAQESHVQQPQQFDNKVKKQKTQNQRDLTPTNRSPIDKQYQDLSIFAEKISFQSYAQKNDHIRNKKSSTSSGQHTGKSSYPKSLNEFKKEDQCGQNEGMARTNDNPNFSNIMIANEENIVQQLKQRSQVQITASEAEALMGEKLESGDLTPFQYNYDQYVDQQQQNHQNRKSIQFEHDEVYSDADNKAEYNIFGSFNIHRPFQRTQPTLPMTNMASNAFAHDSPVKQIVITPIQKCQFVDPAVAESKLMYSPNFEMVEGSLHCGIMRSSKEVRGPGMSEIQQKQPVECVEMWYEDCNDTNKMKRSYKILKYMPTNKVSSYKHPSHNNATI